MAWELTYNGYTFNDYTHTTVSAEMVEDSSGRTITYHRYKLTARTTIVAEAGDSICGDHFLRIRQRLSKAGQELFINLESFGPPLRINGGDDSGIRDVAFGPKPRVLEWEPVGATNAAEVTWQIEFTIPTCNGLSGVRYWGIAALNYSITYRIDKFGYTTRTVAGYIEIAMTREGRDTPDTADAYREEINIPTLADYQRETTWSLSEDKRRANFTITDTQIHSKNPYPSGVIEISANHRVGWRRRMSGVLTNAISCSVELDHHQPGARAWAIFQSIVAARLATVSANNPSGSYFIESLDVDEDIFGHRISFFLTYRVIPGELSGALAIFFPGSGLFTPHGTFDDWKYWRASADDIQTHRGLSRLSHDPTDERIVDLCEDAYEPGSVDPYYVPGSSPSPYGRLCNPKPPVNRSYVDFWGELESVEENQSVLQISVGGDDLEPENFDPSNPTASNGTTIEGDIERFIEEAPPGVEFIWRGYAERLGYDIPRPGKITIGGVTLVRYRKGRFKKQYIGQVFCQPLYRAVWEMRFIVAERPAEMPSEEADPYDGVVE